EPPEQELRIHDRKSTPRRASPTPHSTSRRDENSPSSRARFPIRPFRVFAGTVHKWEDGRDPQVGHPPVPWPGASARCFHPNSLRSIRFHVILVIPCEHPAGVFRR